MTKLTMETKEGFIVNSSKDKRYGFVWFVRHKTIDDGKPKVIQRGDLESYLKEQRDVLLSTKKPKYKTVNGKTD